MHSSSLTVAGAAQALRRKPLTCFPFNPTEELGAGT